MIQDQLLTNLDFPLELEETSPATKTMNRYTALEALDPDDPPQEDRLPSLSTESVEDASVDDESVEDASVDGESVEDENMRSKDSEVPSENMQSRESEGQETTESQLDDVEAEVSARAVSEELSQQSRSTPTNGGNRR